MLEIDEFQRFLEYNPSTGIFRWKVSRGTRKSGAVAGKVTRQGYIHIGFSGKLYAAHRLAWLFVFGTWPKHEIDHINRNKADNRIENLRDITRSENKQNTVAAYSNNGTGLLGVSKLSGKRLFSARIMVSGKAKCLGTFTDPIEASRAYQTAKNNMHIGVVQ